MKDSDLLNDARRLIELYTSLITSYGAECELSVAELYYDSALYLIVEVRAGHFGNWLIFDGELGNDLDTYTDEANAAMALAKEYAADCKQGQQLDQQTHYVIYLNEILPFVDKVRAIPDCSSKTLFLYNNALETFYFGLFSARADTTDWGKTAISELGQAESLLGEHESKCAIRAYKIAGGICAAGLVLASIVFYANRRSK